MPSRTPRAACASAERIGVSVITPVPASSACRIGTRLPTRIESVAASRAASRLRSSRPITGERQSKPWIAERAAGRRSAKRRPAPAIAASPSHATHVACRKAESAISTRVRIGNCWWACWKTWTTCGTT